MADRGRSILVPLDGSVLAEQAIPYALALAGKDDHIRLLTVIRPPEPHEDLRGWRMPLTEQDQARAEEEARNALQQVGRRWGLNSRVTTAHVAAGEPAHQIVAEASQAGASLIVVASRGRGAFGRLAFGSVADQVARTAETPVLIVRPQDAPVGTGAASLGRFIVALDESERSQAALPVVQALAGRSHHPVHLIQVLDPPDALLAPLPDFGAPAADQRFRDAYAQASERALVRLADLSAELEKAGLAVTWSLEVGDPFEEIDALAHPGDIVAVTSHGRSGFSRWTLGSLTEKLVHAADAPVLVVSTRRAPAENHLVG